MKLNQLIRVILNLLGIYTIFTAIVSAGFTVILLPVSMIFHGLSTLESSVMSITMVLFQFFLPLTIGALLVWKNQIIADQILKFSGIEIASDTPPIEIKEFPLAAFSLLGLYMLSQTIPDLFQFIAYLFQLQVNETSSIGAEESKFLENHLQDIIYHVVAIGFAFLVFMKGKSFGKFALSLRK